ncbi:baseplate J/gp47 family protein [Paenibacillus whitsoniae]|uniref:Baseplate J/gp47 family protein n=1 Tax=Paenibacillus whitsoniae TaxID=2496558 RepID=A0A430JE36_9BACL|nr:baseplate J/gp47 family protein [Paenibacillus whitsoniae]RTE09298.1 baseplate J/gp47 family protein [Paenibacillus whitsoniae]
MYESQSYAVILRRMLDRIPDDVDKRQGSMIYDALAPAASELAQLYVELDMGLRSVFPQTAVEDHLDDLTEPFGLTRNQATYAVRKGVFAGAAGVLLDVPVGSRFSISGVTYAAVSKIAAGQFEMRCETLGVVGNQHYGTMLPIDYIAGLVSATLSDVLIPGAGRESDASYRARFFSEVREPTTSGNKANYKKWALEVDGVGGAQVIPLWDGPGTVKVIIIDTNKQPASPALVSNVQAYIDPGAGTGDGQAPIGAAVTVVAATSVEINITGTISLDGSRTLSQVQIDFESALTEYLADIAFSSDPSVKYARVGAMLLNVAGVADYSSLLLNGASGNASIDAEALGVLGTVTLSV